MKENVVMINLPAHKTVHSKLCLAVLLIATVMLVPACGGGGDGNAASATAPAPTPTPVSDSDPVPDPVVDTSACTNQ